MNKNCNAANIMTEEQLFKNAYKGNIRDKYHFISKLSAKGSSTTQYLVEDRKDKRKYMVEAIHKSSIKCQTKFTKSVSNLQKLDHYNLTGIEEIWEWNSVCFFVMEHCLGGSLQ